jgi:acetyl-CoA acetyltransferase
VSRDVAIVSFASTTVPDTDLTETQLLYPVITEAIEQAGIQRNDIQFTCSGSADYLAGAPFAFVSNLEATGAWPPISESHVEMDGAWALYEAWVRLQHGDVDVALTFSSGLSSRSADLRETLVLQLDPYYLSPLWVDQVSIAALQAQAMGRDDTLADLAATEKASRRDGAAAAILVAGDRARELSSRPVWIRGIDHRAEIHYPGMRDLSTSPSTAIAAENVGVGNGAVDVAELHAPYPHQEQILREALKLGDDVAVNPSGGAVAENPAMVAGLIRIGEAFRQVSQNGKRRAVAHATSGPALQQNLVCVLEGE